VLVGGGIPRAAIRLRRRRLRAPSRIDEARMWRDNPDPARYLPDKIQAEWFLSNSARVVTRFDNPFLTHQMNAPEGVNLMGNTPALGLTIPATPLTLLAGPRVTLILLLVLCLCGTATAWHYVMSRHLVSSRFAAAVGAGFAAFSPGEISHAGWHPNLVAQFLIPLIIWRVIRLRQPGKSIRNGVVLAALVCYQIFLNEELLFLAALAIGLFLFAYLPFRRDVVRAYWRPFAAGLGTRAVVSVVLLAYPLWFQFFGRKATTAFRRT
jgi:hypothetical protein